MQDSSSCWCDGSKRSRLPSEFLVRIYSLISSVLSRPLSGEQYLPLRKLITSQRVTQANCYIAAHYRAETIPLFHDNAAIFLSFVIVIFPDSLSIYIYKHRFVTTNRCICAAMIIILLKLWTLSCTARRIYIPLLSPFWLGLHLSR